MIRPNDSTPILAKPHLLSGSGRLRIRGTGTLEIVLAGRGHARILRGPNDTARFAGRGRLRHVSASELVISGAHGTITLDGNDLTLEFAGGAFACSALGHFVVETEGPGAITTARGARVSYGHAKSRFRLEGARLAPPAA